MKPVGYPTVLGVPSIYKEDLQKLNGYKQAGLRYVEKLFVSNLQREGACTYTLSCLGWSFLMPLKTIILPLKTNILGVKTKCTNQLIYPLHIAPTAHQVCGAQRWVCASNVFILNHLLLKEFC